MNIPPEWTIMPSFDMGPPKKRRAILWVLAHMIYYCQKKDPAVADRFCRFPTACAMEDTPAGEKAGESWGGPVAIVEGNESRTSKR
jgi:hypothetical protein